MRRADRRNATAREWAGRVVIALPGPVFAMDLTVLNLAVPGLSKARTPSSARLLWIILRRAAPASSQAQTWRADLRRT